LPPPIPRLPSAREHSLKLAKGATNVGLYPEMMDAGVTVGLGTDGVAASGNLNLMRGIHLVAGLFKDARLDENRIGARRALRMATIDGARALGWDDEIGSLEPGRQISFSSISAIMSGRRSRIPCRRWCGRRRRQVSGRRG
jgi:cytosine/adenosine deaminase-related metal-dependent hydrolase